MEKKTFFSSKGSISFRGEKKWEILNVKCWIHKKNIGGENSFFFNGIFYIFPPKECVSTLKYDTYLINQRNRNFIKMVINSKRIIFMKKTESN